MNALPDYSSITIRIPAEYVTQEIETFAEIASQFPGAKFRVGGVDQLVISSASVSAQVREIHDWILLKFARGAPLAIDGSILADTSIVGLRLPQEEPPAVNKKLDTGSGQN